MKRPSLSGARRGIASSLASPSQYAHRSSNYLVSTLPLSTTLFNFESSRGLSALSFVGVSKTVKPNSIKQNKLNRRRNWEQKSCRSYAQIPHDIYSKDLYKILGVSKKATTTEIKSAFFTKAKQYHPDVNKGDPNAQKKFVEISNAYEILRDESKRRTYDSVRDGGGGWAPPQYGQRGQQQQWTPYSAPGYNQREAEEAMWRAQQQSRQSSSRREQEEFMHWYQNHYHDIFKEFEEMLSQAMRAEMGQKGGQGGHWEVVHTPFGTVRRYVYSSRDTASSAEGRASGMGLFGLLGRILGGGMGRGGGSPFINFEDMFHQAAAQLEETMPTFPQRFVASTLPAVLTGGRLQLYVNSPTEGISLGTVTEVGTNLLVHEIQGYAPIKAHKTFTRSTVVGGVVADVIKLTSTKRGKEVLVGTVQEYPPVKIPLLGVLNNFFTRFIVSDERGSEVLLVSRVQLPFVSWMSVFDTKHQKVASARMGFSPFPTLRTRWKFDISTPNTLPIHPSVLSILAGFATLDKWRGLFNPK